ncbi:pyridoxal phosphate-dependent aminotransferase [Gloeothece citriformis]|nr:pyridoxal phosphate-dependent aminotransferase [Gloeothece citriformis]
MPRFNSRMETVQSPIIPVIGQLIRENPGTISLGQGVVSYGPPEKAIAAIPEFFLNLENHKYKTVIGISPLREIIAEKLSQENGISITPNNAVVVTAGGNMGFMNAILAITSPGDEIIINTPYYFNHEMAIMMADCRPILVNTDDTYQLRPEAIEAAITAKTKAVVTISPNNPTGAVYPEETLRRVNEICRHHNIYHIHDEAYEYFTYNGISHFSPASIPESEPYTISLYSLSKAYGFASWRIGYMVIPDHLLEPINKIQDTILICPPVISQYAALGALKTGKSYCQEHLPNIIAVRDIVLTSLQELQDRCTLAPADGAFYCFLKVHTNLEDFELVKTLIQTYKVAVLPGMTFGTQNGCYLRLAYGALKKDTAKEGIGRLVEGIKTIVK